MPARIERSAPAGRVWLEYVYWKHHPVLQYLPNKLAEWIGENMQGELGFPDKKDPKKWSVSELNNILRTHVVCGRNGCSSRLQTLGCLEWESERLLTVYGWRYSAYSRPPGDFIALLGTISKRGHLVDFVFQPSRFCWVSIVTGSESLTRATSTRILHCVLVQLARRDVESLTALILCCYMYLLGGRPWAPSLLFFLP